VKPSRKKVPWLILNVAACGCWLLVPVFAARRDRADCLSNLRRALLGLQIYSIDFDDRLPPSRQWAETIVPYVANAEVFACPRAESPGKYGHAYASAASGKMGPAIADPNTFPIFFDSADRSWSAVADFGRFPKNPRHGDGDAVAFLSGVRLVRRPAGNIQ
jgi:hypothetical protein